ncbi:MAG: hypothetical protein RQ966_08200 [Acetobacteraceae bacterium]|nr:hypothetical protein [Acetobacteraceae bacterium]
MSTLEFVRKARRFRHPEPQVLWRRRGALAAGMLLTVAMIADIGSLLFAEN